MPLTDEQKEFIVFNGSILTGYRLLNPDKKINQALFRWYEQDPECPLKNAALIYNDDELVERIEEEKAVLYAMIGGLLNHPLSFKRQLEEQGIHERP
jgi:hypothetical protein